MRNPLTPSVVVVVVLTMFAATAAVVRAEQRAVTDPAAIAKVDVAAATVGPAAGKRDEKLEVVALIYGPMPAGVALTPDGRTFLTFPRWSDAAKLPAVELLKDGTLKALANERIDSAQGIDIDARGRVWLLDPGSAILRAFDARSGERLKQIELSKEVRKVSTYANDVRVDLARGREGFAYISDTAGGGVVVVDLATGDSWRRLSQHESGRPDEKVTAMVEGKPVAMRGAVDGIALSPDGKTLYYHGLTRRALWSISTDLLADRELSDSEVEAGARKIADKSSCADGICADGDGRVYTTDYEDHAVRRVDPKTGTVETIVQDARILWPDAVWVHGGYVYVTTNQMNRGSQKKQPFGIFRYPVDAKPTR